ncbi:hypothetical protein [Rhizobium laguerreae]|uniref:hypothetical protein n=1 Tax=Rhizobium laguerreae TaxID=1076926 RepID=UPI0014428EE3|nr:hypothetical protein [Rhizobium laguerreae]NKM28068.1 hypothetical protein [Rhizobium laguerreae]
MIYVFISLALLVGITAYAAHVVHSFEIRNIESKNQSRKNQELGNYKYHEKTDNIDEKEYVVLKGKAISPPNDAKLGSINQIIFLERYSFGEDLSSQKTLKSTEGASRDNTKIAASHLAEDLSFRLSQDHERAHGSEIRRQKSPLGSKDDRKKYFN